MTKKNFETFATVWNAIADTPAEAANLHARAGLMIQLIEFIKTKKWPQSQTSYNCDVTYPRMNDLLNGKISKFSLDALINIATALDCEVRVKMKPITSYL